MTIGSGLLSDQRARLPHLVEGKRGVAGEVDDLRQDLGGALEPLAAFTTEEFTNPVAASAVNIEIATATTVAARTVPAFAAAGVAALAAHPRNIVFTTAGATPADAPATVVVTGKDVNGNVLTETVTLSQIAGAASTVKCFSELTSIVYAAADGTAATIAIGVGAIFGLGKKIVNRANLPAVIMEISDGSIVGSGGGGATTIATNNVSTAVNQATLMGGQAHYVDPDAADLVSVVADVLLADGAQVIASQPDFPRTLQVRITDGDASITAGEVTLVGRNACGEAITQVIPLTGGTQTVVTDDAYAQLTSATVTNLAGHGAGDNIGLGVGAAFGLPIPSTATLVDVIKTIVDSADETVAGVSSPASSHIVEPTSVPNAALDYTFHYFYSIAPVQDAHNHVQNTHAHGAVGGTGGTFVAAATSLPNGSYEPAVVPNGAIDYNLFYEYDPTA
jgi:hypothetical protein